MMASHDQYSIEHYLNNLHQEMLLSWQSEDPRLAQLGSIGIELLENLKRVRTLIAKRLKELEELDED